MFILPYILVARVFIVNINAWWYGCYHGCYSNAKDYNDALIKMEARTERK